MRWISNPTLFGLPAGGTLPARLAFVSVAIWWLLFSIPLLRGVREPALKLESDESRGQNPVLVAFRRMSETFHDLKQYRQAVVLLLAYVIYSDGIGTIMRMAAPYGTELGIPQATIITAILIVQFVGISFSFLFGMVATRIGAKRGILLGLFVYGCISIFGYYMHTATHFFILALLVGTVQGGTQGISRSLSASIIPPYKSGEFFGFFSVFSKFAGLLGSVLVTAVIASTDSIRPAILALILFFIVGAIILRFVDVEEGQRIAAEAEAKARPV